MTRLIPCTSFVMRDEMRRSTSGGKTNQSAVMKSSDCTARSAITCRPCQLPERHHVRRRQLYLLVGALVAHNANCLDREQDREGLADLVVELRATNLLDIDAICVLENFDLFPRHRAEDTDGETWAGERMALDEMCGDGEQTSQSAHFVCMVVSISMRVA